jgi:hypothetical protein
MASYSQNLSRKVDQIESFPSSADMNGGRGQWSGGWMKRRSAVKTNERVKEFNSKKHPRNRPDLKF